MTARISHCAWERADLESGTTDAGTLRPKAVPGWKQERYIEP